MVNEPVVKTSIWFWAGNCRRLSAFFFCLFTASVLVCAAFYGGMCVFILFVCYGLCRASEKV